MSAAPASAFNPATNKLLPPLPVDNDKNPISTSHPDYQKKIEELIGQNPATDKTRLLFSFGADNKNDKFNPEGTGAGARFIEALREHFIKDGKEIFKDSTDEIYIDKIALAKKAGWKYMMNEKKEVVLDIEGKPVILNDWWKEYYLNAMLSADLMLFVITTGWIKSGWCALEMAWFSDVLARGKPLRACMLFVKNPNIKPGSAEDKEWEAEKKQVLDDMHSMIKNAKHKAQAASIPYEKLPFLTMDIKLDQRAGEANKWADFFNSNDYMHVRSLVSIYFDPNFHNRDPYVRRKQIVSWLDSQKGKLDLTIPGYNGKNRASKTASAHPQ